ncbi:hypothetical protein A2W24_04465 [Microgenomates group bacterium RBG_16_45_19]|nr:MAG: hypothetical protein A2W24_04465 [Microgenomates group bacterium RBG_16_45_19]
MEIVTKTATQARAEFFDLIAAAKYSGQTTKITKNGKAIAKIVADTSPAFNWVAFKKALEDCKAIFTKEDETQIKQVRLDSYKNKYPEW